MASEVLVFAIRGAGTARVADRFSGSKNTSLVSPREEDAECLFRVYLAYFGTAIGLLGKSCRIAQVRRS